MAKKEMKPAEFTATATIELSVPRWRWNDGAEVSVPQVNKELKKELHRWLVYGLDLYLNQGRKPKLKSRIQVRSQKFAVKGSK